METLLIFLAIAVIQIIAAYFKQKKEAAKKAAKKAAPPPQLYKERPPEATEPVPDPFREIREIMGLPPVEERCLNQDSQNYEDLQNDSEVSVPEVREVSVSEPLVIPKLESKSSSMHKLNLNMSDPAYGILWAAILQEPRYRVKWKAKCCR